MPLLAGAAKYPDEIWLRWEESRGKPETWLLKRRYIKTFEIVGDVESNIQYGLTVLEIGEDGWSGSSAMVANADRGIDARRRYIEKQRDGFYSTQNKTPRRRIVSGFCTAPLDAASGSLYGGNQ